MLKIINKFHSSLGNFLHITTLPGLMGHYQQWCIVFQHIWKWDTSNKLHSPHMAWHRGAVTHRLCFVTYEDFFFFQTWQPVKTGQTNCAFQFLSVSDWYLIWLHFQMCWPAYKTICLSPAQLLTHFHDILLSLSSKVLLARSHRSSTVWDSRRVED